ISNAMRDPSGDQLGSLTPPFSSVSSSASPPSTRMRQRLGLGSLPSLPSLALPRAETNAIHLPSGDQVGAVDDLSPPVSCRESDPSLRATCTCDGHSLSSPSMTALATTNATRPPSGDTRTDVTRLTLKASSGVHADTGSSAAPTGATTIRKASVAAIRMSPPQEGQAGLYGGCVPMSYQPDRRAERGSPPRSERGSKGARRSAPLLKKVRSG